MINAIPLSSSCGPQIPCLPPVRELAKESNVRITTAWNAASGFGKTPEYRDRNASEFLAGRTPIFRIGAPCAINRLGVFTVECGRSMCHPVSANDVCVRPPLRRWGASGVRSTEIRGVDLSDRILCCTHLPAASRAAGGLLASDEVGSAARARKLNQSDSRLEFTRHTLVSSKRAAGFVPCSTDVGGTVWFVSTQYSQSLKRKGLSHVEESLE